MSGRGRASHTCSPAGTVTGRLPGARPTGREREQVKGTCRLQGPPGSRVPDGPAGGSPTAAGQPVAQGVLPLPSAPAPTAPPSRLHSRKPPRARPPGLGTAPGECAPSRPARASWAPRTRHRLCLYPRDLRAPPPALLLLPTPHPLTLAVASDKGAWDGLAADRHSHQTHTPACMHICTHTTHPHPLPCPCTHVHAPLLGQETERPVGLPRPLPALGELRADPRGV